MYMYHIYVYTHLYIHTQILIYTHTYTYVHICTHIYIFLFINIIEKEREKVNAGQAEWPTPDLRASGRTAHSLCVRYYLFRETPGMHTYIGPVPSKFLKGKAVFPVTSQAQSSLLRTRSQVMPLNRVTQKCMSIWVWLFTWGYSHHRQTSIITDLQKRRDENRDEKRFLMWISKDLFKYPSSPLDRLSSVSENLITQLRIKLYVLSFSKINKHGSNFVFLRKLHSYPTNYGNTHCSIVISFFFISCPPKGADPCGANEDRDVLTGERPPLPRTWALPDPPGQGTKPVRVHTEMTRWLERNSTRWPLFPSMGSNNSSFQMDNF